MDSIFLPGQKCERPEKEENYGKTWWISRRNAWQHE